MGNIAFPLCAAIHRLVAEVLASDGDACHGTIF